MIKEGKMPVAIPIIPVGFFLHDSYWSHPNPCGYGDGDLILFFEISRLDELK